MNKFVFGEKFSLCVSYIQSYLLPSVTKVAVHIGVDKLQLRAGSRRSLQVWRKSHNLSNQSFTNGPVHAVYICRRAAASGPQSSDYGWRRSCRCRQGGNLRHMLNNTFMNIGTGFHMKPGSSSSFGKGLKVGCDMTSRLRSNARCIHGQHAQFDQCLNIQSCVTFNGRAKLCCD